MTHSGTVYVGTHWVLGCLASEPLSYAGVSSLVDVLVRNQILIPLTPSRKGHRTMTSTVYNQSNDPSGL